MSEEEDYEEEQELEEEEDENDDHSQELSNNQKNKIKPQVEEKKTNDTNPNTNPSEYPKLATVSTLARDISSICNKADLLINKLAINGYQTTSTVNLVDQFALNPSQFRLGNNQFRIGETSLFKCLQQPRHQRIVGSEFIPNVSDKEYVEKNQPQMMNNEDQNFFLEKSLKEYNEFKLFLEYKNQMNEPQNPQEAYQKKLQESLRQTRQIQSHWKDKNIYSDKEFKNQYLPQTNFRNNPSYIYIRPEQSGNFAQQQALYR